jgi:hypothetical protein
MHSGTGGGDGETQASIATVGREDIYLHPELCIR